MTNNFNGCVVLVYNNEGNQIAQTSVLDLRLSDETIMVSDLPFNINEEFDIIILTTPTPVTSKARMIKHMQGISTLRLSQSRLSEKRKEARYPVDIQAAVMDMLFDNVLYPLHTPVGVNLINLSKNGTRLSARNYTMLEGDFLRIRLKIGANNQIWTLHVVNQLDRDSESSEYGCKLMNRE